MSKETVEWAGFSRFSKLFDTFMLKIRACLALFVPGHRYLNKERMLEDPPYRLRDYAWFSYVATKVKVTIIERFFQGGNVFDPLSLKLGMVSWQSRTTADLNMADLEECSW